MSNLRRTGLRRHRSPVDGTFDQNYLPVVRNAWRLHQDLVDRGLLRVREDLAAEGLRTLQFDVPRLLCHDRSPHSLDLIVSGDDKGRHHGVVTASSSVVQLADDRLNYRIADDTGSLRVVGHVVEHRFAGRFGDTFDKLDEFVGERLDALRRVRGDVLVDDVKYLVLEHDLSVHLDSSAEVLTSGPGGGDPPRGFVLSSPCPPWMSTPCPTGSYEQTWRASCDCRERPLPSVSSASACMPRSFDREARRSLEGWPHRRPILPREAQPRGLPRSPCGARLSPYSRRSRPDAWCSRTRSFPSFATAPPVLPDSAPDRTGRSGRDS